MMLACCGGQGDATQARRHVEPKLLWSFVPDLYYSDLDFHEAAAFSADLAIITKLPEGIDRSLGVVALDAKTKTQRWKLNDVGWLVHPPGATEPLYFAPAGDTISVLDRIDPRTGALMSAVSIPVVSRYDARIAWSPDGPLEISGGTLRALDWQGKPRWTADIDSNAYIWAPIVVGTRVIVPGNTTRAFALADGAPVVGVASDCCGVVASPSGRHVFTRAQSASHELDANLHVARELPGVVLAASDTHYAIERPPTTPGASVPVDVYAYGASAPAVVLSPQGDKDYYSAIALDDTTLFYFHAADATFCERDLTTGKVDIIDHISGRLVISPDATGMSPATLSTPPIIARPYLFSENWGVHAYFIGQ